MALFRPLLLGGFILLIPIAVDALTPVGNILTFSIFFSLVAAGIIIWSTFNRWLNTLFLITTERVVWLQQKGPFNRLFEELALTSIFQVSHTIQGVLPTLFGYGDLHLYTGGSQSALVVPSIGQPYEIQQEIQDAVAGVNA